MSDDRTKAARRPFLLSSPAFYLPLLTFVVAIHLTLLRLPYFWDEGGYYIPAALDFYHHGWLIPNFTNAHPPLPNVLLGSLWHLTGVHILATRLFVCAVAASALFAVFRLAETGAGEAVAFAVTLLTALYPIWYAQSSLAHADIFAATFSLWALALYFNLLLRPAPRSDGSVALSTRPLCLIALLFTLAVLSKETAVVNPAALAVLETVLLVRAKTRQRVHARRVAALASPVLPLAAWFAYHRLATGFTFGNPEYLRYNATANLTASHIFTSLWYRFLHLAWQRNIWLPILIAAACLLLPCRPHKTGSAVTAAVLTPAFLRPIVVLLLANWLFFSVLGGALLTRYLLPMYPLILLLCVALWYSRTTAWPWLVALTALVFVGGWWLNPPTAFAPEDNLTYRDMIVVQQKAIDFVATHYPDATTLTAWPVAADVFRPELGYVATPLRAISLENFSPAEIARAAQEPERYDTAIVFTTHYLDPGYRAWLLAHPTTRAGREFARTRDLSPAEIAALLHGRVVWQRNLRGEWAAVLRFDRAYEALLLPSVVR